LDFAFFGVARFAALLRPGLALALPRFELFFRVATRFFALAMAASCELYRRQANLGASQLCCMPQRFTTHFYSASSLG
jgi:hypothetical protein